jgi:hypothetical protein
MPATLATLDKVTAGDWRSPENRARDIWRHPKETLKFFGFRQDMTVLEIWPGGGGWYTEIPRARAARARPLHCGRPGPSLDQPVHAEQHQEVCRQARRAPGPV